MIFATVGTQVHQFDRFVQIINEIEKEDVVLQYGVSRVEIEKKNIKYYDFIDNIDSYIEECEIIITHGGVATIMNALKKKKKIVVIPRLKKCGEHVDNHQLELVSKLAKDNYIYSLAKDEKINEVIEKIRNEKIVFEEYVFDNHKLIDSLIIDIQ